MITINRLKTLSKTGKQQVCPCTWWSILLRQHGAASISFLQGENYHDDNNVAKTRKTKPGNGGTV